MITNIYFGIRIPKHYLLSYCEYLKLNTTDCNLLQFRVIGLIFKNADKIEPSANSLRGKKLRYIAQQLLLQNKNMCYKLIFNKFKKRLSNTKQRTGKMNPIIEPISNGTS